MNRPTLSWYCQRKHCHDGGNEQAYTVMALASGNIATIVEMNRPTQSCMALASGNIAATVEITMRFREQANSK